MANSDFENGSFTPEGRTQTLQNLEYLLDQFAMIGAERDDEPPDEPDTHGVNARGLAMVHHQPLRRPLRAYLAARAKGVSPGNASLPTFQCHTAHPTDAAVTLARVRFDAVALALHHLEAEAPAEEEEPGAQEKDPMVDLRDCVERTRTARNALARYRKVAEGVVRRNAQLVSDASGRVVTTIPAVHELRAVDELIEHLMQVELELGAAGALRSPDFANLTRGSGGKRTPYSLGRVLVSISQGVVGHQVPGKTYRRGQAYRAFTFEERMAIVLDRSGPDDDDGRDKRYKLAEAAYRDLCSAAAETRKPSTGLG